MKQRLLILAASAVMTLSSVNAISILNPQMEAQVTEAFQDLCTAPEKAKQFYKLWYTNLLAMSDLYIKYADLAIKNSDQLTDKLQIELMREMTPIAMNYASRALEINYDISKPTSIDQLVSIEGRLNEITGCLDYVLQNLFSTLFDNNSPQPIASLAERRAAIIELKNFLLTLKDFVE